MEKQIFFLNFICLYDYAFNIIYSLLDENRLMDIKNIYIYMSVQISIFNL